MARVPSTRVGITITVNNTQATRRLRSFDLQIDNTTRRVKAMDLQLRRLDRTLGLMVVGALAVFGTKFVKMAAELETAELQIRIFSKSAEEVPKVMDSILKLTTKVPFNVNEMTKSFVRLKASGLEPIADAQGNGMLKNIADGVAAFGGTSETFKRAIIGMQQIAGKGVVSMEELRQQIGEAIPTAMRIMAREMNISVAKLISDVSRGKIEAQEGLQALSEGFKKAFGGAGEALKATFLGQIGEFENQLTKLSKTLVKDTGALKIFTAGIALINDEMKDLRKTIEGPRGASMIEDFTQSMIKLLGFVQGMIVPFKAFGSILSDVFGIFTSVTTGSAAGIAGGGLLGFLLYGRMGAKFGALFGAFSREISGVVSVVGVTIKSIVDMFRAVGGDDTIQFGLIGLLIWGKRGAMIGLAFGFIKDLFEQVERITTGIKSFFEGLGIGDEEARARAKKAQDDLKRLIESGKQELAPAAKKTGEVVGKSFGEGFSEASGNLIDNLTKKMAELQGKVTGFTPGEQTDIGGPSPQDIQTIKKLTDFLISLEIRAAGGGDAMAKLFAKTATKLNLLNDVIANINDQIDDLAESDSRIEGLNKELVTLAQLGRDIAANRDKIIADSVQKNFKKLTAQISRANLALNEFLIGTPEHMDATAVATAKVESRFAGMKLRVVQMTGQLVKLQKGTVEYRETLIALMALQRKLTLAEGRAIERIKEVTQARKEAAEQASELAVRQAQLAVGRLGASNEFDRMAEAALNAELKIISIEKQINRTSDNIRKKMADMLIDPEVGKERLAQLDELRKRLEENSDKFIERMRFNVSNWGILMNSIAQSVEDNFARSFAGIVKGTMTAKEALLNFYSEITDAVARYLVKQALIGAGIGGGGGGQALGGFFQSFFGGIAGPFSSLQSMAALDVATLPFFANGGSMRLGGRPGVDNNLLSLNGSPMARVSAGETLDISPVGGGPGGATYNINISAMDAADVQRLFTKHGSDIIGALDSRRRINRGFDRT